MSRAPFVATILRYLLPAFLAASPVLYGQDKDITPAISHTDPVQDEADFRKAISVIESSHGAYASGLSEQLLSLGLSLQSQGQHDEAVDLFKRGVHLARINDGLYSTEQIPLLQGQITSHIALGNYDTADERQRYMYRVQIRSMDSGEPRTMAFMQQANWQHNAYRLGLGQYRFVRIMNMWDLYRLALNDIITREGETSPNLLPPLHGMLQAQYLISGYQWEDRDNSSGDDMGARQNLNRFNAYRAQSYQKGQAVITAIYNIEQERDGDQSMAAARALIMQGDWQLWHAKRDAAWQAYQDALMELAERDDAKAQVDYLLGEPVALPDIAGLRPLPPAVATDEADILLEFDVSESGRVVNLERLDENEQSDGWAHRLMRKLRKTQFRPRFEAGHPIETEKLVRAFNIE